MEQELAFEIALERPLERREVVLWEYRELRAEILGYQRDSLQILAFAGAVSAAFFAFSGQLAAKSTAVDPIPTWHLFAFLQFLLFPAVLLQVQRLRSTYRIGRYIQHMLEPKLQDLRWETFWFEMGKTTPTRNWFGRFYSFKYTVCAPIIALQVAALVALLGAPARPPTLILVIIAVLIAALLVFELWLIKGADDVAELAKTIRDFATSKRPCSPPVPEMAPT